MHFRDAVTRDIIVTPIHARNQYPSSVVAAVALSALLAGMASFSCRPSTPSLCSVTFVASVKPAGWGEPVYLTGDNAKLGDWDPAAVPMERRSDSVFTVTRQFPRGTHIAYKITAGSWWVEALNQSEALYSNFHLTVDRDMTVTVEIFDWLNRMKNGRPVYGTFRFDPRRPPVTLDGLWRYHSGDDPAWAAPALDDSAWPVVGSYLVWEQPTEPRWNGIGWFRFRMYVDSSLWNTTVALRVSQLGASEIYYNGRLLYSCGTVGSDRSATRPQATTAWQPLRFDPQPEQLIAVRYANDDVARQKRLGLSPGFILTLRDLTTAFRSDVQAREDSTRQIGFTVVALLLFILHLFLYGFLRQQRQHLYYAVCMLGFAGVIYFNYQRTIVPDVADVLLFLRLNGVAVAVAIFFGVLTIFETAYERFPKRIWFFLVLFVLLAIGSMAGVSTAIISRANYGFFILTAAEGLIAAFAKNTKNTAGGVIPLVGFVILSIFVTLQILIDYAVIPGVFGLTQVYVYGVLSLAVSMSVFLSYNFARMNRGLERQLVTVRELSEKTLEQERQAHALALERRVIELESERKSRELESARQLQLSLLPKEVPAVDGL